MTMDGVPPGLKYHTAVWTGTGMLLFGGRTETAYSYNNIDGQGTYFYTPNRTIYLYQRP